MAKEISAGNWRKWESFAWFGANELDNPNEWALAYTVNRDSDVLTRANDIEIKKRMAPYVESGDACRESHTHWACGWIEGYRLRGAAIDAYNAILDELDGYPVLCDETLSECEDADEWETWENCYRGDVRKMLESNARGRIKPKGRRPRHELTDDEIDALYFEALQRMPYDWEHDNSGCHIDCDRLVGCMDWADLKAAQPA